MLGVAAPKVPTPALIAKANGKGDRCPQSTNLNNSEKETKGAKTKKELENRSGRLSDLSGA